MLIAALLAAFTGCGGDSTGVDGGGDDVPLPERVQMSMTGDLLRPAGVADTIRIHLELGGGWDVAKDSIDVAGGLRVDSGALYGAFLLGIASPLAWPAGSPPLSGRWTVDTAPRHLETTVITAAGGTSEIGVRLSYADGGPTGTVEVELPWSTFFAPPPSSLAWVQWAAFAYGCLDIAHAHLMLVANSLALAIANDDALVRAGSVGLEFSGTHSPLGAAGSVHCRLQDNGSGDFGPGDALEFTHTSWWIPAGSTVGRLVDGSWSLTNYIENADPFAVGGQIQFGDTVWRRLTQSGTVWQVSDPAPMSGTATLFVQRPS